MITATTVIVVLAIGMVRLISERGESFSCTIVLCFVLCFRVLLDSASKASFVTETVAYQLALQREKSQVVVSGFQGSKIGRPTQAVKVGNEYSAKLVSLPMHLFCQI